MLLESFHPGVLALLPEEPMVTSPWPNQLSSHLYLNPFLLELSSPSPAHINYNTASLTAANIMSYGDQQNVNGRT